MCGVMLNLKFDLLRKFFELNLFHPISIWYSSGALVLSLMIMALAKIVKDMVWCGFR